jgi:hypothetical protein
MLFLFPESSPGQAKLIALHSGFLQTFLHGNAPRKKVGIFDLPSANTFANVLKTLTLTGFTYRGLSPHKFTPMPGVHLKIQPTQKAGRLFKPLGKKHKRR